MLPAPSRASASATVARGLRPPRMLVVDDLPEICSLFRDVRRRMRGVDVELQTEVSSRHAIGLLATEPYDLVVSDFRMPGADGVDVLSAAWRTNPWGYRVLMTGYNEIPTPVARIQQARIDAYVRKPLRVGELVLLLRAFLEHDARAIADAREHARLLERTARVEERGSAGSA